MKDPFVEAATLMAVLVQQGASDETLAWHLKQRFVTKGEHDRRVTELIRACSHEVVRRRVANVRATIFAQCLERIETAMEGITSHLALATFVNRIIGEARTKANNINPEDYGRP